MPKRISEKTKFTGRIFRIKDVLVRHDNGREFTYEVMQAVGGTTGAMMVAVDDAGRVVLVKEYFVGIDKTQLCLPKGRIDAGEKPADAARRELEEETGYAAKRLKLLARVNLSPGYSDQTTYIYLATGLSRPKRPSKGDEVEPLTVVLAPLAKAVSWVKAGKICEARAVAGLLLAEALLMSAEKKIKEHPQRRMKE
jgi:ADP-ribose diphosphatase